MKQALALMILFLSFTVTLNAQVKTKGGPPVKEAPKSIALATETVKFEGTFDSKRGVMSPISCHGSNVGYLTTESGERVAVCFDRMEEGSDIRVDCESGTIWVEGTRESHYRASDGPCTESTMNILYVTNWGCN